MNKSWWAVIFLCIGTAIIVSLIFIFYQPVYVFPNVAGPAQLSTMANFKTPPRSYELGSENRLIILLTDEKSSWLSLVYGFKTIGIPVQITRDYKKALKHKVVMVYPTISGAKLSRLALEGLANHARSGGVLIASEVIGGGLEDLFGFININSAQGLKTLRIAEPLAGTLELDGKEELELPLSTPNVDIGTYKFTPISDIGKVLARYEEGSAAIIRRDHGLGRTYVFGFDIGDYFSRSFNGRQQSGRAYVNAYEPGVDILYRILLKIYRESEPLAVTVETVPNGKSSSLIVTHDIDYKLSLKNAIEYAEYEKSIGVIATYFVQTKYVRDWSDENFYNKDGMLYARKLHELGMEVGSHGVSHSTIFSKFPIGDGTESYPQYVPFVKSKFSIRGGSILGELRVSRFLLEKTIPGLKVVSFRPGHLEYPDTLAQALQVTGFRYSSSMTTGQTLTHLPFQLSFNRIGVTGTGIYEFPITIEDELQRPMTSRLNDAKTILHKLQRYGGMMVVLIHPNVFEDKMDFLKGLLSYAQANNVWIGSLGQFAVWWEARDQVEIDVQETKDKILLEVKGPDSGASIVLRLPVNLKLEKQLTGNGNVEQHGECLHLNNIAGLVQFSLVRDKTPLSNKANRCETH